MFDCKHFSISARSGLRPSLVSTSAFQHSRAQVLADWLTSRLQGGVLNC
jgi:hypothetical protein